MDIGHNMNVRSKLLLPTDYSVLHPLTSCGVTITWRQCCDKMNYVVREDFDVLMH